MSSLSWNADYLENLGTERVQTYEIEQWCSTLLSVRVQNFWDKLCVYKGM